MNEDLGNVHLWWTRVYKTNLCESINLKLQRHQVAACPAEDMEQVMTRGTGGLLHPGKYAGVRNDVS
jgi:hypothetical protein